jgi:hypothetical protein
MRKAESPSSVFCCLFAPRRAEARLNGPPSRSGKAFLARLCPTWRDGVTIFFLQKLGRRRISGTSQTQMLERHPKRQGTSSISKVHTWKYVTPPARYALQFASSGQRRCPCSDGPEMRCSEGYRRTSSASPARLRASGTTARQPSLFELPQYRLLIGSPSRSSKSEMRCSEGHGRTSSASPARLRASGTTARQPSLFELPHYRHLIGSPSRSSKSEGWWAVTDSNRRLSACKADALPAELTALAATCIAVPCRCASALQARALNPFSLYRSLTTMR